MVVGAEPSTSLDSDGAEGGGVGEGKSSEVEPLCASELDGNCDGVVRG